MLLANCDMDLINEKYRLLPRVNFYTDVCKIILDTLRNNSKTLNIYNNVAI